MRRQHLAGAATMAVGMAMISNALLGPLAIGAISFHESAGMETQLLGGELTSLFIAGPLAVVAGLLWWRGSPRAPALALGALGYALYTHVQLVLVPDYARYPGNNERFFPLYLLVVMTSWIIGLEAWRALQARPLVAPNHTTARVLGGVLVTMNTGFAFAWWASIASTYVAAPSSAYLEHPTAFWLVRLMDLGFVIPIGIVTGLGLLQRKPWASRLAYAFTGTQMLLACAVAGMALRMWVARDAGMSVGVAMVITSAAAGLVVLYGELIVHTWTIDRRISLIARYATARRAAV
jgi:hypothetical protein